mgnify:CR=1 FL=1
MSMSLSRYLIGIATKATKCTNVPGQIGPDETPSQCLAIALIVLDTHRPELPEVASFYSEIQFDDSRFEWSAEAEEVHGLSREHLADAAPMADVAYDVLTFIRQFVGRDEQLVLLGHDPVIERGYLIQVLAAGGHEIKLHHLMVDGFTLGFSYYGLQHSGEQFAFFGKARGDHHALDDIRQTAEMLRVVRQGGNRKLVNAGMPPAETPAYAADFVRDFLEKRRMHNGFIGVAIYEVQGRTHFVWHYNEGFGDIDLRPVTDFPGVVSRMIGDGLLRLEHPPSPGPESQSYLQSLTPAFLNID